MIYLDTFFSEIYKIIFLLLPVLVSVALIVWLDRRVWAFVQKRKGPNVVGPFGLLQTLADALKYIFKEIIIPASANKSIFVFRNPRTWAGGYWTNEIMIFVYSNNEMVKVLVENDITIDKVLQNKKKIAPILNNYANTINYQGGTQKFIKEVINKLAKT